MGKLISAIVNFCVLREIVAEDDVEWFRYGLRSNEGNSGSSVKTSYSLPLRGGAATTMGTSAHNYSSAEYGDWICGIEISK